MVDVPPVSTICSDFNLVRLLTVPDCQRRFILFAKNELDRALKIAGHMHILHPESACEFDSTDDGAAAAPLDPVKSSIPFSKLMHQQDLEPDYTSREYLANLISLNLKWATQQPDPNILTW